MASYSHQPKRHDGVLSKLNVAIAAITLAKEVSSITPAKVVFGSVSVLLTMIRDSLANEQDYVEIGLNCADVCKALDRGLHGSRLDDLNEAVTGAIEQLTTTVAEIQRKVIKQGKRNVISRFLLSKDDKEMIATKRQDLNRILHIFNTELLMNILLDIHQNASAVQEGTEGRHQSSKPSVPLGESPPPAPRTCFGRDELIEELIALAGDLEPIALIGAGGVGKTSIALKVLHHDRIKDQFGDNRRFIRCDQFPASRSQFLARLSRVIGAGIENPENLIPLRPFLSSQKILIVLDNAESVLDPQGTDAQEIYGMVDELCQFSTICLFITSRFTTVPRHCKRPEIATLSIEAAQDIFYSIHADGGPSGIIDRLLRCLDFHALSITLLATTASHNRWNYDELEKEWEMHRAQILRTEYNESLAATIELTLASPTFRKLGANAQDLLGVVAFFPQGVDERNLDSFFPTISDRKNIFNKFRVLSLTHRDNGFITMLAPIRDYLRPQDPTSSALLCGVKDCYFSRLSTVDLYPGGPGFEEAKWIRSEDVNVEHLLNVFTTIDINTDDVWDACVHFMDHLYWHQKRQTILGPKIKDLPDDHPSKPICLLRLSTLFESVGNYAEQKVLLSQALRLEREVGNAGRVALTLAWLSETNRMLRLFEEAIRQAHEALEIYERLGLKVEQASCLIDLASSLHLDNQLDLAEEAASRALKLLPQTGQEFLVCKSYRGLGKIYHSKGERENAIYHFKTALGIATTFNWPGQLFWIYDSLAGLFLDEDKFGDAQAHIEQAKSQAVEGSYELGRAMMLQARIWFRQSRLEDARSEALSALEVLDKLAAERVQECKDLLHDIEHAMKSRPSKRDSGSVFSRFLRLLA